MSDAPVGWLWSHQRGDSDPAKFQLIAIPITAGLGLWGMADDPSRTYVVVAAQPGRFDERPANQP